MKHTNFGFLLREGTRAMFKHGFMSFAAVCITVACLVIVASFGLVSYNLGLVVDAVQDQICIVAFINPELSEAEARSIGSQINLIPNVSDASFLSQKDVFEQQSEKYGAGTLEGLPTTTFRAQYIIHLENYDLDEETVLMLEKIPGIQQIRNDTRIAAMISGIRYALGISLAAFAVGLVIISLIIISNTIKLAMMDRREEIGIMKMVGATNGFIRLPFLVEGLFLGIIGGALAFFIEWFLYRALYSFLSTNISILTPVPFEQLWLPVAALCGVAGLVIGVFGSLMSIRRFLKV